MVLATILKYSLRVIRFRRYIYIYISKLQSKSAPCQSEVLVLKKGLMRKSVILENFAPLPLPTPILRNIVKCSKTYGKNIQKMS